MTSRFLFLLFGLLICSFGGCFGGDSRPQISGTVTLDGALVENGWVTFSPVERGGKNAAAKITDGKFSCPIEPADYRVEIRSPVVARSVPLYDSGGPTHEVSKESIPGCYNEKSKLTVTVATGNNLEDFELLSSK